MASAASDTYLTCNIGSTFKRDMTFADVDVSTLASMAFELCAYPGGVPLLTVTPSAQSDAVARVTITKTQLTALGSGCFYYYFRITTVGGENAAPIEGVFRVTP